MITFNVGCSGTVNWIQTKTNLLRRFPPGARYLIGVSGGRDSVVLLDAIADLDYRKLIVCHFDHQLRGRFSQADARFVEKLAAKYDVDLTIVRPLLEVWRDEIDRYVRQHRLKFREDASNKNLAPLRNRFRRRVIPYLEKTLGRKIGPSILRAATIAAEEEAWIDSMVEHPDAKNQSLSVEKLRSLPTALQRRFIMTWLREQSIADIGFDVIERVRSLLDPKIAKINLPRDRHARRRGGKIFIE